MTDHLDRRARPRLDEHSFEDLIVARAVLLAIRVDLRVAVTPLLWEACSLLREALLDEMLKREPNFPLPGRDDAA